tara:strand:+ start:826 stop:1380 length:555 start_codon:yes stop_codon:yes gene_type:complete
MFTDPPRYRWKSGDKCYLYGVLQPFTVENVTVGYGNINAIKVSQRHLQRHIVLPYTYKRVMKQHSHYLYLSGLEQRKPIPWRVLEQVPTKHLEKWKEYKKTYTRTDFLAFIRSMCPRVHIDDNYRILFKDQPKRNIGDTVYLHGYADLKGSVSGTGNKGWYIVECPLGVLTCHRSTLWCRGYGV